MRRGAPQTGRLPGGERVFQRMFTRLGCQGRPPHFQVEFYPYANLMHTIRLKEDWAHVRLSDLVQRAPMTVLEATAAILLARLYRRRAPQELVEVYRSYASAQGTRRRLDRVRRERGQRLAEGPQGKTHDLEPMFGALNRKYFDGTLHRPRLGWSRRAWRAQLGCFDPALDQIVINVRLDRESVPEYAVEYVLYHEMLHVKHPLRVARCGLEAHSREFRREEQRFHAYRSARRFLDRLA